MDGTRRLTLREAAEELGVSVEAARKRVKRGSLESDKEPDGRVYVYLDAGVDERRPELEGEDSLVEELRDQVAYLRSQLDVRAEEIQRRDVIISQLTQATSNLTDRLRELEAPQRVEEEPEGAEARSAAGGASEAQERPQAEEEPTPRRSWWREFFGFGE